MMVKIPFGLYHANVGEAVHIFNILIDTKQIFQGYHQQENCKKIRFSVSI